MSSSLPERNTYARVMATKKRKAPIPNSQVAHPLAYFTLTP
jgi:hypothetical protein